LDGRLAEAWPRAVTGWEVTHSSQGEKMRRVDERCYTWSIHVNLSNAMNFIWLVVWNHGILRLSIYWECHHPNLPTHIFQGGRSTAKQIKSGWIGMTSDVVTCHRNHGMASNWLHPHGWRMWIHHDPPLTRWPDVVF
jgi:hypothetical protein